MTGDTQRIGQIRLDVRGKPKFNHYNSDGSLQTGGKFYFAGFYSRVLSASEISTNWSVHQTRLGI